MKAIFILISLFTALHTTVVAQNIMRVHNSGNLIYQEQISNVDSLTYTDTTSTFFPSYGEFLLPIAGIDSITFASAVEDEIYIVYTGGTATIINPFVNDGVSITDSAGHVTVTSTYASGNLRYNVLGSTDNGSLTLTSAQPVKIILSHASITNPGGAAVSLMAATESELFLSSGTVTTISDASTSKGSGALYASGSLTINGTGTLVVNGYKKHGIAADATVTLKSGNVVVATAASDGIHADDVIQEGGAVSIYPTGDGIDASNSITIGGGEVTVVAASADVKGLKATNITINDGICRVTVTGDQSKAIKSSETTTLNGGTTSLVAAGSVVLAESGSGVDPSYCTGIKSDGNVVINGGELTITCAITNKGGKGISADGNVTINGGVVNITTAGDGATYTNESGEPDSYAATAISADGHINLLAGTITCSSSGTAGKGVSADSTITIGNANASDDLLTLDVTTSGNRFWVTGTGQDADYANPKAVKAEGNLTVNSGIIKIQCTQTTAGGEGLESKATLTINGGQITANTYDDCINAATHIQVNGGTHSLTARGNDGMDCNGTLTVAGGLTISKGAGGPEEGFDCDMNTFKVLGGIMVGTGGNTSNPSAQVSTQNSLKLSIQPNQHICIKNASNQVVLMYALPKISGGGGFGMGNGKMIVLFSSPAFVNGSYTIEYGGTITGGTNVNGYYTGATYSGGTSKAFTVNSRLTTVTI